MRKLSRKAHGVIDYISVAFMCAAPWLFGFIGNWPAATLFFASAALVLILSLFTNYELGLKRNLPMAFHLDMDMTLGLFLAVSPWLFGFYCEVYLPHVLMGIFAIIAGLVTETKSLYKGVQM